MIVADYECTLDFPVERAPTLDVSGSGALLVPDTAMAALPPVRMLEERIDIPATFSRT